MAGWGRFGGSLKVCRRAIDRRRPKGSNPELDSQENAHCDGCRKVAVVFSGATAIRRLALVARVSTQVQLQHELRGGSQRLQLRVWRDFDLDPAVHVDGWLVITLG